MKSLLPISFASLFVVCTFFSAADASQFLVADCNGDPYGAVPGTGQVELFNSNGTYASTVITGLTVPSALTLGPNGYLYVAAEGTGSSTGEVMAYDPNNNYAPVNNGTIVNGVFASGLNGPGGLYYDGSTLLVSELGDIGTFQGELVKRFNADGSLAATIGAGTGGTGRTGLATDASNNLYVGAFLTGADGGEVLKFNAADNYATENPASNNIFAVGVAGAGGLLFHSGNLYVASQFTGNVMEFDSDGNLLNAGPAISGLSFPTGLTDLGDGTMLVTELGAGGSSSGQVDLFNFTSNQLTTGFMTGAGIGGNAFQPTSVLAVPEPAAALLAAGGLGILLTVFRRNASRG